MSSIPNHNCIYCNKNFSTSHSLNRHIRMIHLGVRFNCQFCDYQSTNKSYLSLHIDNVHLKLMPFQCDQCDQSFGRKDSLKRHKTNIHRRKTITKKDKTQSKHQHQQTQQPQQQDVSNLCNERGNSLTHEKIVEKIPFFNCLFCCEVFPSFQHFRIHANLQHASLVGGLLKN